MNEEYEGEYRSQEGEYYPEVVEKVLSKVEASACLTCIGPTFRMDHDEKVFCYPTFAYIAMEVIGRDISDISVIPEFVHVIYLDLTGNRLNENGLKPLAQMQQLKVLIVDKNFLLNAASVPELKNLQLLSLKQNLITSCEVRELEKLLYLDLSYNDIRLIRPYLWCPYVLPNLTELSMRGTGLKKLAGFIFTNLVSLFLADNKITSIEGLSLLTNLKFLHLRNNPLVKLDGFTADNKKLFYLNVRDCKIRDDLEFKKLKSVPRLERIVVIENPFWDPEQSRLRLIAMLPRLRRINKQIVDEFERVEASEMVIEEGSRTETERSDLD